MIGHEIGHLLVQAAKARTGINLAELYEERVKRNWQRINDSQAPDEEAVTQLSLKVNPADYYFRMSDGQPEAYPENLACINGWVTDLSNSSRPCSRKRYDFPANAGKRTP